VKPEAALPFFRLGAQSFATSAKGGSVVPAICAVGVRKQTDVEDVYRQLESIAKSGRLAEQLAAVLEKLLPKK
jgi:hypothetical protein